jgi:hypothetical protein
MVWESALRWIAAAAAVIAATAAVAPLTVGAAWNVWLASIVVFALTGLVAPKVLYDLTGGLVFNELRPRPDRQMALILSVGVLLLATGVLKAALNPAALGRADRNGQACRVAATRESEARELSSSTCANGFRADAQALASLALLIGAALLSDEKIKNGATRALDNISTPFE